jgi:hypothetical protein
MSLSVAEIAELQDRALARWEDRAPARWEDRVPARREAGAPACPNDDGLAQAGAGGCASAFEPPEVAARDGAAGASLRDLVEAAHFANFMIWGLEDEARRRDVGDARIAAVKRAIDPWNQKRNDLMEAIDAAILAGFANVDVQNAELHSETAGMMIDRLSILALKIRSMNRVAADARAQGNAAQGDAGQADAALAAECDGRARVLRAQRDDLAHCLARLLVDFAAGRRYFKAYRQMKAYNDERLNSVLRAAARRGAPPT